MGGGEGSTTGGECAHLKYIIGYLGYVGGGGCLHNNIAGDSCMGIYAMNSMMFCVLMGNIIIIHWLYFIYKYIGYTISMIGIQTRI